jgi:twitching motility protein PilT
LAGLPASDTAQVLDRIVEAFPADEQGRVRTQLASTLEGVVAQRLVRRVGGGMGAAFEVLVGTSAVRALVREDRTSQLRNVLTTSRAVGMQTLEMSLHELVHRGTVAIEDAQAVALRPGEVGL